MQGEAFTPRFTVLVCKWRAPCAALEIYADKLASSRVCSQGCPCSQARRPVMRSMLAVQSKLTRVSALPWATDRNGLYGPVHDECGHVWASQEPQSTSTTDTGTGLARESTPSCVSARRNLGGMHRCATSTGRKMKMRGQPHATSPSRRSAPPRELALALSASCRTHRDRPRPGHGA